MTRRPPPLPSPRASERPQQAAPNEPAPTGSTRSRSRCRARAPPQMTKSPSSADPRRPARASQIQRRPIRPRSLPSRSWRNRRARRRSSCTRLTPPPAASSAPRSDRKRTRTTATISTSTWPNGNTKKSATNPDPPNGRAGPCQRASFRRVWPPSSGSNCMKPRRPAPDPEPTSRHSEPADRTLNAAFPGLRLRRTRRTAWSRRLVAEHRLSVADLIWPLFVIEGTNKRVPVATMPGVERLSIDNVVAAAEEAVRLGIPAVALFPYTEPKLRTEDAREAFNPGESRVPRDARDQGAGLDLGVILDVALDPYTSHGHDGLMRGTEIANDETLEALVRQSLVQAEAGADILAPSDMMDGRVGAIRSALEGTGSRHADHGVRRQVCIRVLRPVPRCSRLSDARVSKRRQAHLPDGPRQHRRSAARGRARSRRGRRHGDGQAGLAVSRHCAARAETLRRADLCLPGVGRVRDAAGGGAAGGSTATP